MDARTSRYHDIYERAMRDPEGFWGEAARAIDWYEPAAKVFDPSAGIYGRWFVGASCNTCHNALDRHVAGGRAAQIALIYDSPVTGTQRRFTYAELLDEVKTLRRRAARLRCRAGRPRHPLHADGAGGRDRDARMRAHRGDPLGGVRRLRRQGARDSHRRRAAEGDPVGELRHRGGPRRRLQAAARRGDPVGGEAEGLHHFAAPAGGSLLHEPRLRLGGAAGRGEGRRQERRVRASRRDRSAVHPLHVRNDRHPEGRGARQRRPHGRAEMVDARPLRRRARRDLVVRLRRRLGGRPLVHRLRAIAARRDLDPVRGQAGRHAGRRRVLARDRRPRRGRAVHRADRLPGHQEGGSAGHPHRQVRPCRNSVRCSWPASAPTPTPSNGPRTCCRCR